jgi:hypothetical protein
METTMTYKTIILELLQNRPELYEQLRKRRMLIPTVNRLARELKARHEAWKQELQAIRPASDSQIASEAMEPAVKELEDRLSADSEGEAMEFLDATMEFLRPTPPA